MLYRALWHQRADETSNESGSSMGACCDCTTDALQIMPSRLTRTRCRPGAVAGPGRKKGPGSMCTMAKMTRL
eukprot:15454726-Alexandrium_andersonii.AAC.1